MLRARDADPQQRRAALEALVRAYWPPLRAYLKARGFAGEDADDLLQDFVASQVLDRELLDAADPRRGRFRNYLLKALNRFSFNAERDSRAAKRGGGAVVSLETIDEVEDDNSGPAAVMEAAWGRRVIERTTEAMRCECEETGRGQVWEIFQARVLGPTELGTAPPSYRELVERFKLQSPVQVGNLLVTAKRMFARRLRDVVGEYEADERAIEEEIAELRRVVGGD